MLPRWFREYLSFHKSERRGVYLLLGVLVSLIFFNVYQRVFWKSSWEEIELKYGPAIVEFSDLQDSLSENSSSPKPWIPSTIEYFEFDPNTLDSTGWVSLGFSPKQTVAILKYRDAGAVVRKPEDVKKLFVVDESKYADLEPYISIKPLPEKAQPTKIFEDRGAYKQESFEPIIVELNSADTAQLKKLYGIGPSFAKRIVKYRDLLGGYVVKEQVLEVYGMDSARYLPLEESLLVDTTYRTRININTADFKTLLRHPYLNKNQVKAIVNYRKQHGDFRSISELRKIHLISLEDLEKLNSYLSVK